MLPRTLVHPVDELTKAADKRARKVSSAASDAAGDAAKEGRKFGTSASDTVGGTAKKVDRVPAMFNTKRAYIYGVTHATPRVLVWDGEGVVGRWRARQPELTAACHAFRGTLAAKVLICKPGDPEAKGGTGPHLVSGQPRRRPCPHLGQTPDHL
jgi:hypothetical protein